MAPGDTENSYHDGDEAFEVDSDYSYSVEMSEDSSYSDDHDGLSPRVDKSRGRDDESRGRDDESRGRTMGEDDGEDIVLMVNRPGCVYLAGSLGLA